LAFGEGARQDDAANARFKLIATDGVFSMDGYVAKLTDICALADRYGAQHPGRRLRRLGLRRRGEGAGHRVTPPAGAPAGRP
jgi:hypothetical protein